ncbi:MAG: AMP-binding protein [Bacteroidales bacterium]|nr:AMP-binding protein [Bacteroidales bacterium]
MRKHWESYNSLKLDGLIYSKIDLFELSSSKLDNSDIPIWEKEIYSFIIEWLNDKDEVIVNTSGSTGKPKSIQIQKERMIDSAKATNAFFNLDESKTALLCLSAEYIAGKMMIIRAFVGAFNLQYVEPRSDALLRINNDFEFVAVVPLQLENALKSDNIQVLNQIKKIIVGGAAVSQDLIQKLVQVEAEVWASYGMTETITHIALQGLNGKHKTNYFQALQDVEFQLDERECLRIIAPLHSSYPIQTNDRVELINKHQFKFLGRVDFVINSGGIKFSPEILEQKLGAYIENDFAYSSKMDDVLGEKLVLVIEGNSYFEGKAKELNAILKNVLTRFEQPKEILFIQELPKTNSGKLDRFHLKDNIR